MVRIGPFVITQVLESESGFYIHEWLPNGLWAAIGLSCRHVHSMQPGTACVNATKSYRHTLEFLFRKFSAHRFQAHWQVPSKAAQDLA